MRSCRHLWVGVLVASLTGSPAPGALVAQDTACTYDACALRIKRPFFGTRLVQGRQGETVASIVFLAPRLTDMMERSDSALHYYELFRTRHNRALWMGLVGSVLYLGGFVVFEANPDAEPVALGLTIGGGAAMIASLIVGASARDPLSRAIWWYNRSFAAGAP